MICQEVREEGGEWISGGSFFSIGGQGGCIFFGVEGRIPTVWESFEEGEGYCRCNREFGTPGFVAEHSPTCRKSAHLPEQPGYNDFNEAALVERLCAREEAAMAELYDRYSGALFGLAYRILKSREETEDLLQDAFLLIWKRIDSFDSRKGTLFTWMGTVVRNRALDVVRSRSHRDQKKNRSLEDSVSAIERDNPVGFNPDGIGIGRSVERLDPELREVVETLYFNGYTQSEAAEALDIPLGTIKTRARRAIRLLRDRLGIMRGEEADRG